MDDNFDLKRSLRKFHPLKREDNDINEMKIRKPTKKQVWKDVAFKVKSAFPTFGDAPETIRVDIEDKIDELEATLTGSVTIENFTNMVTDAMMEMYGIN